jgi:hypothetical protein
MISDFSKVDEAFISKLKGLQVTDELGALKDVPVVYIDPEPEFQVSEFPTIVVFRQGIYPDPSRWTNDIFYGDIVYDDATGNPISTTKRDAPDPFNVYYGIRLYTQYNQDSVILNQWLMSKLRRGAYLDIEQEQYDVFFLSYKNPEATYRTFGDQPENQQRQSYEQYTFRLEIELDNALSSAVKLSQQLINNVHTK